ncbi:MAG: hypothetical protein WDW38_006484 [Sanguina aurantia]
MRGNAIDARAPRPMARARAARAARRARLATTPTGGAAPSSVARRRRWRAFPCARHRAVAARRAMATPRARGDPR